MAAIPLVPSAGAFVCSRGVIFADPERAKFCSGEKSYLAARIALCVLAPFVVGFQRIKVAVEQLERHNKTFPSKDAISSIVDYANDRCVNRNIKGDAGLDAIGFRSPTEMKNFWRDQIVRGVIEVIGGLVFPIITGLALVLKDVFYKPDHHAFPETRDGVRYTILSLQIGSELDLNLGDEIKLREAMVWEDQVKSLMDRITQQEQ